MVFKNILVLLTIVVSAIYLISNTFISTASTRILLSNGVQFSIGIISFYWLWQVYQQKTTRLKAFWLLLSLGVFFSTFGTAIWFYLTLINQEINTPLLSNFIWVFSYICYLSALIYKIRTNVVDFSNKSYFFNTVIYMIASISISYHYLLSPLIALKFSTTLSITYTVIFLVIDLALLFLVITLYYLLHFEKKNRSLFFLVTGLLLQLVGDSLFSYFSTQQTYTAGGFVDYIWTTALLLIGFTGYRYSKGISSHEPKKKLPLLQREFLFPYLSIIVLTILMIESYDWRINSLSFGWFLIFVMIIARQSFVMVKNKKLFTELQHLAYYDPLTQLGNRLNFINTVDRYLKTESTTRFALILINLNRFKMINDALGHRMGDDVLKEVASRLSLTHNGSLPVFRIGGDEFVILVENDCAVAYQDFTSTIIQELHVPFIMSDHEFSVKTNIGISIYPQHGESAEDLLKNASTALHHSKISGKNDFIIYSERLESDVVRKMGLEVQLQKAIELNQLSVHYQPKVHLQTKTIVGMEALLRWEHPQLGMISPVEFIPIAEETGLINEIGEWVLRTACTQSKQWQASGYPPLLLSVNVSALQFQNRHFCEVVSSILLETDLQPNHLELEITESIVQNITESVSILKKLKKIGVKCSIDDFGTGYSSLSVLEQLPIDTIKIDKSFIDRLSRSSRSPMVKTIVELGLNLQLNVVAEGIESSSQSTILKEYGCSIGQGYLFSKPINAQHFTELLDALYQKNEFVF